MAEISWQKVSQSLTSANVVLARPRSLIRFSRRSSTNWRDTLTFGKSPTTADYLTGGAGRISTV